MKDLYHYLPRGVDVDVAGQHGGREHEILPIPRIHISELDQPENYDFKIGASPFILYGALTESRGFNSSFFDLVNIAREFPRYSWLPCGPHLRSQMFSPLAP